MQIWLAEKVCITVSAMVRRLEEGVGMGVEFVEINKADRARLEEFLRSKAQLEGLQSF